MSEADLLELADRALAGADGDAQATARHVRAVRAEGVQERLVVEVACVRDGRVCRAETEDTSGAALAALGATAAAGSADDPRDGYPGLPDPAPGRPHDGWDPAIARLQPDAAAELDEAVAERMAIVSLRGIRVAECRSRAVHRDGSTAARLTDLGRAAAGWEPVRTPDAPPEAPAAGEHRAVLGPAAVAALLDAIGRLAFNGLALAEGRSPLAGRLGTRVAASAVNLSESPRYTATLPRSYDAEGVPAAPLPLIQDGVAHRVVHDTRSAALAGAGAVSTGHASMPGGAPEGPYPRNLVLVGGGSESEAELLAALPSCLYVAELRELRVADRAAGTVSALLAGAIVRDGRPAAPLSATRFTGAALDVLAGVEALTTRQRLAPSGTVCPALRTSALRVG